MSSRKPRRKLELGRHIGLVAASLMKIFRFRCDAQIRIPIGSTGEVPSAVTTLKRASWVGPKEVEMADACTIVKAQSQFAMLVTTRRVNLFRDKATISCALCLHYAPID
jgi:hypothetical protein